MAFTIDDTHLIQGCTQLDSPNKGGKLQDPSVIVVHYTAAPNASRAIERFSDRTAQVSAHLVIDRDSAGTITQLVPFDRVAWHAGKSQYDGRSGVNDFSIGIELQNYGKLVNTGSNGPETWFGAPVDPADITFDGQVWHRYLPVQIETLIEVCRTLVTCYPSIKDIVGHSDISPGRKIDPGPAFPLATVRGAVFGRQEILENARGPAIPDVSTLSAAERLELLQQLLCVCSLKT